MSGQKVRVEIKGVQNALLVTLSEGAWEDARDSLVERVQSQSSFFRGARLAVDVGDRTLRAAQLSEFRDRLSDLEVNLWAVLSSEEGTAETARRLGLATKLPSNQASRPRANAPAVEVEQDSGVLIRRTLRSGIKVSHPGHVTVIGDVNPGAEVIAGGDVVVWGRLRGVVHAGSGGNQLAMVCALELNPMQLRIADKIAVPPRRKKNETSNPEIARINQGQVVSEPWNQKA